MRLFVLLAVLAVLAGASAAQAQTARYWIVVGTEGGAEALATPRALARRALRASKDAPPHPDRHVSPAAVAQLRAVGVEPLRESRWLGAVSAEMTPEQVQTVRALPAVRAVRPTARLATQGAASVVPYATTATSLVFVAFGPSEAQLRFVRADETINAGRAATGVLFGSLDTQFDFTHPALAHVPASGHLVAQQDFVGGEQSDYHGLATTSVALGYQEGVLVGPAWDASVLAATTEFAPTETHAEEDAFVAGIEWMEQQGVDVVSVSLGYSTFDAGEGDYTYADMDGNTAIVTRAADAAVGLGVAVVVSAGNEGSSDWMYVTAPGDGDLVLTVGAADDTGVRSSFSSIGPTADGRTKPDVAALGRDVYLAGIDGGAGFGSGTSFSAPMVAGIVGQMLGARPSLTPAQVRDILHSTSSQAATPDNQLGWGIVDAVAALASATTVDPEPTPGSAWAIAPNVTRPGRALRLTVGTAEAVQLDLVDVLGRRVATWDVPAGSAQTRVSLPGVPPGAYFVRIPGAEALRITVVR